MLTAAPLICRTPVCEFATFWRTDLSEVVFVGERRGRLSGPAAFCTKWSRGLRFQIFVAKQPRRAEKPRNAFLVTTCGEQLKYAAAGKFSQINSSCSLHARYYCYLSVDFCSNEY